MRKLVVDILGASGVGKSALLGALTPGEGGADERPLFSLRERTSVWPDARPALPLQGDPQPDACIVVVVAGQPLTPAIYRQVHLASLRAQHQLVVVVNKMDLVGFAREPFATVEAAMRELGGKLAIASLAIVPAAADRGTNVREPVRQAEQLSALGWYDGPSLTDALMRFQPAAVRLGDQPLRVCVTGVSRGAPPLEAGARTVQGLVVAGSVRSGDPLRIQPSGRLTRAASVVSPSAPADADRVVGPGEEVALTLADGAEVAVGDLIVPSGAPAEVADQFEATIVWSASAPLLRGRTYRMTIAAQTVTATITPIKFKIDPVDHERIAATRLVAGDVGVCNLQLDRAIPFDPYRANRVTGGFILSDRVSGAPVGVGMLHFALRRAQNVHWQALDVNKGARAGIKGQRPCVLWYTGLSGAGKSTIANLVDKRLHSARRHTYLLDGDNVRHGLNRDLGFTDADRVENIRRIAEVAKLMVDAGLIVSTAFISPFRAERQMARALLSEGEFIEIFVDTPLEVAEHRDPKGLYKKARRGDLKNFTGIDSPYEPPEAPELRIDTTTVTPEQAAETVVAYLHAQGIAPLFEDK